MKPNYYRLLCCSEENIPRNSAMNDMNQPSTSNVQTAPLSGKHDQTPLKEHVPPTQTPCSTGTRKRQRNYSEWKAIKPKLARQSGKAYVSPYNGKLYEERKLIPLKSPHTKCRTRCSRNFDDIERQTMLNEYWIMPQSAKDQHISSLMRQEGAVDKRNRKTYQGKRKAAPKYYLVKDGIHIQVGIFLL